MNNSSFLLEEIVDISILQEIQDKFAEATGLAAVITNAEGNPVTAPSNFSKFCKYIRSSQMGWQRCVMSDAKAGKEALHRGKTFIYTCPSGLTDLASPIIVNNQYMGVFLCGQIQLFHNVLSPEEIRKRNYDLGLEMDLLIDNYKEIEIIDENKVKASAELLMLMTNYIVKMGIVNIVQQQLMSEMKAKSELEKILRETEYKALKSQINPHFLFNILNTIVSLANLEEAPKTQEVAYALSELLRNSLKNTDKVVNFKEEIDYVKKYLFIQETRFGDRIKIFFDIDEKIINTKLPAMTLQPLVENAIVHGLEPKKVGGILRITAFLDNNNVVIEISDTGLGMPKSIINEIFTEKYNNKGGHVTGLGIYNVHRRIQYHFGEEYGLQIESRINQGTKVKIIIPFIE
ncbi:MAG: hypothetical protein PWQ67_2624 [Clostridia bacterium]|nr:hypothetical protein [Clostridia bacterium]